jgi:predicted tellurium resistance membrane protein TerC
MISWISKFAFERVNLYRYPAVFGVTQDPFIVYSSNIFAILSLRSLYAFVATMVAELEYLQTAVAAVLGFVVGGCTS